MLPNITLPVYLGQNQKEIHLIDIRTPEEFALSHCECAINIPYDLLMMYPESYLSRENHYYLICSHGNLSNRASAILQSYGYFVGSIENGYQCRCFCCYRCL